MKYVFVDPSEEARRLGAAAVAVGGLKLGILAPRPLFFKESTDDRADLETPRRILGCTWPSRRTDLEICLRSDLAPQTLVEVAFHEVEHFARGSRDLELDQVTPREISEGFADMFASAEAPIGRTYDQLLEQLYVDGAKTALEADRPTVAALFARRLEHFDPVRAKHFEQRAGEMIRIQKELDRLNAGWESPREREARRREEHRRWQQQVARDRQRRYEARRVEEAIARARKAVVDARLEVKVLDGDGRWRLWRLPAGCARG